MGLVRQWGLAGQYGVVVATKLALVVRTDLDLGRGKIAVQVAHAAVAATLASIRTADLVTWLGDGQPKVVLRVGTAEQRQDIVRAAREAGLPAGAGPDAGRRQRSPGTLTCCAICAKKKASPTTCGRSPRPTCSPPTR